MWSTGNHNSQLSYLSIPSFIQKCLYPNSSKFVHFLLNFFFLKKMSATFFFQPLCLSTKRNQLHANCFQHTPVVVVTLVVKNGPQVNSKQVHGNPEDTTQTVHADMLASNISNSVKSFHKTCRLIVRFKKKKKSFCCFMVFKKLNSMTLSAHHHA